MAINKLSSRKVDTASPGKYGDGGNLQLVVTPTRSRYWVFRYTRQGKTREIGLGSASGKNLSAARQDATRLREIVRSGGDPARARDSERADKRGEERTFNAAAARFIFRNRHQWDNRKHRLQWPRTLRTYASPVIGQMHVQEIETKHVLEILQTIWTTKPETAKRVQGRIERILDFARAIDWRTGDNPARWRGHLSAIMPAPSKIKTVRHHPAMPYSQVPTFFAELQEIPGTAALALRFLILTACRTGEVLKAQWEEIDEGVWTIPAERMKARRPHRAPLVEASMQLLEQLPRIEKNPYIFAGARYGRSLSSMALLTTMRARGYGVGGDRGDYVPHGFRSAFRDWCGECTSFPTNLAEAALAHVLPNRTEAAYARGDLFDKRRELMAAWAAFCTGQMSKR